MSLLRRISACVLAAIIFIMLITGSKLTYAEELYPLEDGEKLIEETVIDENHAQIFTRIGEDIYIKEMQRNKGQWIIENTEAIQPKGTGLKIKEIDKRGDRMLALALERELSSYGLEAASLPLVIDYSHSEFLPPIGDQGLENSCVGWATGYYLRTYQQARDIGWEVTGLGGGIASHIFSPSFIYNQIRQETEYTYDGGAFISDAGNLLKNMGAATLENFPYILYDIYTLPDQSDIQSAIPHKIREWALLYADDNTDQYIIQKTKEYLNTGDLVVAGSRVGLKFMENRYKDQNGNSIITREDNPPYAHAYIIVGYDDTLVSPDGIGAFKLVNSWGKEWGNDGFSYISYEAFAANATEGFVFTDLVNREPQELTLDINDNVIFNMNFSGTGRFDFKIKDSSDKLIYEESNLRCQEGLSSLTWSGKDMAGNNIADGLYKFSIIPYKGDTPKPAFDTTFNKLGKVESARALAYSNNYGVQYVELPIVFKSDGMMSIKVDYNGTVHELISNQAVIASESNTYIILKRDFDFNNIDLNQVKIVIDIQ